MQPDDIEPEGEDQIRIDIRAAIDDYRDTWEPVDEVLYGLCDDPRDPVHAFAKVTIIDGVYTTGLARKPGLSRDQANTLVRDVLIAPETVDRLQTDLAVLGTQELDPAHVARLVTLHEWLVGRLHERLGSHPWSFTSKYLHFHCPTVPIFDERARQQAAREVALLHLTQQSKEIRRPLPARTAKDNPYPRFVANFLAVKNRLEDIAPNSLTAKQVDHYLLSRHGKER